MGVHHNQQTSGVGQQHGVIRRHKGVGILRQLFQLGNELLGGVNLPVNDNVGLLALFAAQAHHTGGSAQEAFGLMAAPEEVPETENPETPASPAPTAGE